MNIYIYGYQNDNYINIGTYKNEQRLVAAFPCSWALAPLSKGGWGGESPLPPPASWEPWAGGPGCK